jgi:hypothetical protein
MILNIFFSIKIIIKSKGGKKNFGQITEKYYFSKSRGAATPTLLDPSLAVLVFN